MAISRETWRDVANRDLIREALIKGRSANYEVDAATIEPGVYAHLDGTITTDTKEAGMDRLETIKARMRELEAEAAALKAVPDPAEYPDDTTLSFERSHSGGAVTALWYTYVAVKAAGVWHTTGRQTCRYSDVEFWELLARPGVRNVFRATEWEPVAKTEADGSAVEA